MATDLASIANLLRYLDAQIAEIEKMQVDRNLLEKDPIQAAAVKYMLQTAIEATSLNLGVPETGKEVFQILSREKIN